MIRFFDVFITFICTSVFLFNSVCLANPTKELTDKNPTVSIIMSHYNNEKLVARAIESILNQTYQDFEFLICDDGSTDNSLSIIKKYAAKDPRIKVLENGQNRGISHSRNRLYAIARGKYAAIMDSDDISEPTRLEKEVSYLNNHPEITVVSTYANYIGKGINPKTVSKPNETGINMLFYCSIADGSSMTRIDFIRQHNLKYDETLLAGMDYKLWSEILIKGGKFYTIPEQLYFLHHHRSHKPLYYQQQSNISQQIRTLLQNYFYPVNESTRKINMCQKMWWIREKNQQLKWFDDRAVLRRTTDFCPPDDPSHTLLFLSQNHPL